MIHPAKMRAELEAAGLSVKALSDAGRVVVVVAGAALVVEPDGRAWAEASGAPVDVAATRQVHQLRAAHDPTPPPAPPRRDGLTALALVVRDGQAAPAWALVRLAALCSEAGA